MPFAFCAELSAAGDPEPSWPADGGLGKLAQRRLPLTFWLSRFGAYLRSPKVNLFSGPWAGENKYTFVSPTIMRQSVLLMPHNPYVCSGLIV